MEISPFRLTLLLICSVALGATAGVFNDISRIIRVFCGVRYTGRSFDRMYNIPMPFTGKRLGAPLGGRVGKTLLAILIFIQDLLLMLYMAAGAVCVNYYLNDGQFRLYTPIAMLAGFAIYYFTVGRLAVNIFEPVTFFIRAGILTLFYVILYPFKRLFDAVKSGFLKILKKIREVIAKRRDLRYNKRKRQELEELSRIGFIGDSLHGFM